MLTPRQHANKVEKAAVAYARAYDGLAETAKRRKQSLVSAIHAACGLSKNPSGRDALTPTPPTTPEQEAVQ